MPRRGDEEYVGDQPHPVGDTSRDVELFQTGDREQHVSDQEHRDPQQHEQVGGDRNPVPEDQTQGERKQDQVADRVSQRDQALRQGEGGVLQVGRDQEHPPEDGSGDPDDECIGESAVVAISAGS